MSLCRRSTFAVQSMKQRHAQVITSVRREHCAYSYDTAAGFNCGHDCVPCGCAMSASLIC